MEPQSKLPPQALEIEQAVLGAFMLEKQALKNNIGKLTRDMFRKQSHKLIFDAIKYLFDNGSEVDCLLIVVQLKKMDYLDLVGGVSAVAELSMRVASAANIEYHIQIIHQKYLSNQVIERCGESMARAYDDYDAFDEINHLKKQLSTALELVNGVYTSSDAQLHANYLSELDKRITDNANGIQTAGLQMLWPELATYFPLGFQKGKLYAIGAKSATGKSAFASQLIRQFGGAYFSFEMGAKDQYHRFVTQASGVNGTDIETGDVSPEDHIKIVNCNPTEKHVEIFEGVRMSVDRMRSKLSALKEINFVVVDSGQMMYHPNLRGVDRLDENLMLLKQLAIEFDAPVLVISQISRLDTDRRITINDFKGSGGWEFIPDSSILMHGEAYTERYGHNYRWVEFEFPKIRNAKKSDPNENLPKLLFDGSVYSFFDTKQTFDRSQYANDEIVKPF